MVVVFVVLFVVVGAELKRENRGAKILEGLANAAPYEEGSCLQFMPSH